MLEGLNRMMLFGLGALNMSRQRAEELFDECVKRGEAESSKRDVFVKDLMDASDRARNHLEEVVSKQVRGAIEKLRLATAEDLARVEAKLDKVLGRKS